MTVEVEFSSAAPGAPVEPTPAEGTEAVPIGSALTDAAGAPAGHVTNHGYQGLRRLCLYFQKKPRMAAYLAAVMSEVQKLEDLIWACYELDNSIDFSSHEGVHLDVDGEIVGEPRLGRTDVEYRPALRARIKVNKSSGKIEELYGIMALISPGATLKITEYYPCALVADFSTLGTARAVDVRRMLRQAKAGGVRLDVSYGGTAVGSVDGTPAGGAVGSVDGSPAGFVMGSVG